MKIQAFVADIFAKQVGLSRATLEFQVYKILSIVKLPKLDPDVAKMCCQ